MSAKLAALVLLAGSAAALSGTKPFGSKPDHVHAARAATITPSPTVQPTIVRRQDAQSTLTTVDPSLPTPNPLVDYYFPYDKLPYKVNPYPYLRGPQSGYNLCNSTTAGDESQCQTLIVNSIVRDVFYTMLSVANRLPSRSKISVSGVRLRPMVRLAASRPQLSRTV
jgi:hypothetical protein